MSASPQDWDGRRSLARVVDWLAVPGMKGDDLAICAVTERGDYGGSEAIPWTRGFAIFECEMEGRSMGFVTSFSLTVSPHEPTCTIMGRIRMRAIDKLDRRRGYSPRPATDEEIQRTKAKLAGRKL